ncbi:MAG: DCC1-like thiol-disulfide oxidoreductase family protein [Candidatus Sericytochromatia bacterium]|nr:DCC1-like thiol-disulfide oxidoreductase family protein [Candidatus Sericytochromatia bacterium]
MPPLHVLFDGECATCHALVRLALRHPARAGLRFVPLGAVVNTPAGDALAHRLGEPLGATLVVLRDGEALTRSDAVLALAAALGGAWQLAGLGRLLPRPWRDALYDALAARRHRLGLASVACEQLPAEARGLVLDSLPPEALAAETVR